MAIAVNALTAGNDATDATSYVTASVTFTSGRSIALVISTSKGTTPDLPSSITGGPTFTQITGGTVVYAAGVRRITLYHAIGDGTTGALTLNFSATQTGCAWIINDVTGDNTGSPSVQTPSTNTGTGTAVDAGTLGAFSDANNGTFMICGINANVTLSADAGWTNTGTTVHASPNNRIRFAWRADNDTTPTATAGGSGDWGAVGFEWRVASTGSGGAAYYFDQQRAAALSGV